MMNGGSAHELTHAEVLAKYLGAFVEELSASGVRDVCLCPGSRSTPLALILSRHPRIKLWMHLDERSCAYFALGMARASGRPVGLVCTSGSAAANFAPAVVEAFTSRVPLVVMTADRPQELRDLGANQTFDQVRLYGSSAKWFVEMLLPEAGADALRYVRMVAARAVATALADAPGPVHLNFPLREPLVPADPGFATMPDADEAPLALARAPRRTDSRAIDWLDLEVDARVRGIIVCGPQDDPAFAPAVCHLAERLGYPVLADPLSGVRCGDHGEAIVIGAYDAFLRVPALIESLAPDMVLRFGAAPVSKPLATFLQRHRDALNLLVTPDASWRDPELTASAVIETDAAAFCDDLSPLPPDRGDTTRDWLEAWRHAEESTVATLAARLGDEQAVSEPGVFFDLAAVLPEGATVFAGNSMPVRDLDGFFPASTRRIRFLGNRGVSGIDGVVSSALGASAVLAGRLVLVIGDLSFYHDMNGLLAARCFGLRATIVLVNNDGGGIFSFLPQHDDAERFETLFGTPHGLDFGAAAELYGLRRRVVSTPAEYRAALVESFASDGVDLIELRTEREQNLRLHQRLWSEVAAAITPPPVAADA